MRTDDEDALVLTEEAEGLVERDRAAGRRRPKLGLERDWGADQDKTDEAADQVAQTSSQGAERREANGGERKARRPQRTGAAPSGVCRMDSRRSG